MNRISSCVAISYLHKSETVLNHHSIRWVWSLWPRRRSGNLRHLQCDFCISNQTRKQHIRHVADCSIVQCYKIGTQLWCDTAVPILQQCTIH